MTHHELVLFDYTDLKFGVSSTCCPLTSHRVFRLSPLQLLNFDEHELALLTPRLRVFMSVPIFLMINCFPHLPPAFDITTQTNTQTHWAGSCYVSHRVRFVLVSNVCLFALSPSLTRKSLSILIKRHMDFRCSVSARQPVRTHTYTHLHTQRAQCVRGVKPSHKSPVDHSFQILC